MQMPKATKYASGSMLYFRASDLTHWTYSSHRRVNITPLYITV